MPEGPTDATSLEELVLLVNLLAHPDSLDFPDWFLRVLLRKIIVLAELEPWQIELIFITVESFESW